MPFRSAPLAFCFARRKQGSAPASSPNALGYGGRAVWPLDAWHFALHQARDVADALVAGRERLYLQAFFDARVFNTDAITPYCPNDDRVSLRGAIVVAENAPQLATPRRGSCGGTTVRPSRSQTDCDHRSGRRVGPVSSRERSEPFRRSRRQLTHATHREPLRNSHRSDSTLRPGSPVVH
jgi:hypothetical protein